MQDMQKQAQKKWNYYYTTSLPFKAGGAPLGGQGGL